MVRVNRIKPTLAMTFFVFLLGITIHAQTGTVILPTAEDWEKKIIGEINRVRIENGNIPYYPDPILAEVADEQARYVKANGAIELYIRRTSDASGTETTTTLPDWLAEKEYITYKPKKQDTLNTNDYTPDILVFISSSTTPDRFVANWLNDPNFPSTFRQTPNNPIYSNYHREIGVAFFKDEDTNLSYYVVILGARPNVYPIFFMDINQSYLPVTSVTQNPLLYIANETIKPNGDSNQIGQFTKMRVANEPLKPLTTDGNCPPTYETEMSFFAFDADYPVKLTSGIGPKTVYVQLCDSIGRGYETSLNILLSDDGQYSPPTDTPTITATVTSSPTPITPSPTLTETPSLTPSATETASPTATNTIITDTPSSTPSATETASPTATLAPTETPSPTPSATETASSTATLTPTETPSLTPTLPTATETPSPTVERQLRGSQKLNLTLKWNPKFLVIENKANELPTPIRFESIFGDLFEYAETDYAGKSGNCVVIYNATEYDLTVEDPGPSLDEIREIATCQSDFIPLIPIYTAPFWALGTDKDFFAIVEEKSYRCDTAELTKCSINSENQSEIDLPNKSTTSIQLLWDTKILAIINTDQLISVDLSTFSLDGIPSDIIWEVAENGNLARVLPGDCLLIYVGAERPDLTISGLVCTRIIADLKLNNYTQDVWMDAQFTTSNGTCDGWASGKNSCEVIVDESSYP